MYLIHTIDRNEVKDNYYQVFDGYTDGKRNNPAIMQCVYVIFMQTLVAL